MNMIQHQMAFLDPAFLLQGQFAEYLPEVPPQFRVQGLSAASKQLDEFLPLEVQVSNLIPKFRVLGAEVSTHCLYVVFSSFLGRSRNHGSLPSVQKEHLR